jgi:hypothetical protein
MGYKHVETPESRGGNPPLHSPAWKSVHTFWGVNTSWGINTTENKRPLQIWLEDNQAPHGSYEMLHIKITHFDSVASVIITKVASVAFFSQGRKCRMLLTSVTSVKESILP